MEIFIQWIIMTITVLIAAYLIPGVNLEGFTPALIAALILGVLNAFIRPFLMFLSLPINILTFGLFTFVINALLIMLTGAIVPGFQVESFWWALLFSVVLSVILSVLSVILRRDERIPPVE